MKNNKNFSDGTTTFRIKIATRDAAKARAKIKGHSTQEYIDRLIIRDLAKPAARKITREFMDI